MNYTKIIEDILEDENIWMKNILKFYYKNFSTFKIFSKKSLKKDDISITENKIKKIKQQLAGENKYVLNKLLSAIETLKKDEEFKMGESLAFISITMALLSSTFGDTYKNSTTIFYSIFMIFLGYIALAGASAQKYQFKSRVFNKALITIQISIKELLNEIEESNFHSEKLLGIVFIDRKMYRRSKYVRKTSRIYSRK